MTIDQRKISSSWTGRSLSNYKDLHGEQAREQGVYKQFMAATTLTRARKILRGEK